MFERGVKKRREMGRGDGGLYDLGNFSKKRFSFAVVVRDRLIHDIYLRKEKHDSDNAKMNEWIV